MNFINKKTMKLISAIVALSVLMVWRVLISSETL